MLHLPGNVISLDNGMACLTGTALVAYVAQVLGVLRDIWAHRNTIAAGTTRVREMFKREAKFDMGQAARLPAPSCEFVALLRISATACVIRPEGMSGRSARCQQDRSMARRFDQVASTTLPPLFHTRSFR